MLLRTLYPISMIVGFAAADDSLTMLFSDHIVAGHSLEDVFGKVDTPDSTVPYHNRPAARDMRFSSEYFKHRSQEVCDFPIELLILQDATNSFSDDIVNMRDTQLQLMIDALSTSHPGTVYATMSFKDKPLWPLGESDDYCVRFGSPFSPDASTVIADYANLAIYGGGDPPEAQFIGLVAATQSNTPGWGSVGTATRLIVVATDAAPHFNEDGFNVYNLPPFSGTFDEANNDQQCVQEYYPGPDVVRSAIQARQVYLGSLVYDGSYDSHLPIESWKWFNSYINQSEGFVFDMEDDSSNFWERLSQIITELEEVECGPSTTTPAPTEAPTPAPTEAPTPAPTEAPTPAPTEAPTPAPTEAPTEPPTEAPTEPPTPAPTVTPIGSVETSAEEETGECPPCPSCPAPGPCPPCCEGVIIKIGYKPQKLSLNVEN